MLMTILRSRAIQGALTGALSAAGIDFQAFRAWKSFDEARHYSWGLAAWRWFQGAVVGAITGAGYGAAIDP
jgi:hypothetical protein